MLEDSFDLVFMNDKQDHNSFMCIFDFFFTNILLEKRIYRVIKNVFGRKKKRNGLNKSILQELQKLSNS